MNTKKITGYEIGELLDLLHRIEKEIDEYRHVSDHLPKLKKLVNDCQDRLSKEREKREEEYL